MKQFTAIKTGYILGFLLFSVGLGFSHVSYSEEARHETLDEDADQDGFPADQDCDDNNPAIHAVRTFYEDLDGDGFGDINDPVRVCSNTPPEGALTNSDDCNDNDPNSHPDAGENCTDTFDNNCNGLIDSQDPDCNVGNSVDADRDGFPASEDCNDNDPTIHAAQTFYEDNDGDGFGDLIDPVQACSNTPPAGTVTNSEDCNDNNIAIHPGINENCTDEIDNNCDDKIDSQNDSCNPALIDADEDGFPASEDCNDSDPTIHTPRVFYEDNDGDGFGDDSDPVRVCNILPPDGAVTSRDDCNDNNITVNPGATENCTDEIDNDCDDDIDSQDDACNPATVDADRDGFPASEDCNDNNPAIHAARTFYKDIDNDGFGDINDPVRVCNNTAPEGAVTSSNDCNDNDPDTHPDAGENCTDTFDNNCNELIDSQEPTCNDANSTDADADGFPQSQDCNDNDASIHAAATYFADADDDGFGDPDSSLQVCSATAPNGHVTDNTDCDDTDANVHDTCGSAGTSALDGAASGASQAGSKAAGGCSLTLDHASARSAIPLAGLIALILSGLWTARQRQQE